jgi:hypothetical protein
VETDILTSQDLVLRAAQKVDPEVLVSVLSGREAEWTESIITLLDKELLFDRRQFGLSWNKEIQPSDLDLSVSPELKRAEVRFLLSYSMASQGEEFESIGLQQTAVYRTSNDRWLLSPPTEDFWGDRTVAAGHYVSVEFPDRDAEIGRRLASDLEAILGSACTTTGGLNCPEEYQLSIILSTDPQVMVDMARPTARFEAGSELTLPTPTLMGLPVDETGYRALQRAYVVPAVTRMINDLSDWECCDQALVYGALLDLQLSQLGIQVWPANPGDYSAVLREPLTLERISRVWETEQNIDDLNQQSDWWMVYALVEYLSSAKISTSSFDMQNKLPAAESFNDWLNTINRATYTSDYIDQSWNTFLHGRIVSWQGEPPIPFPEQDVAMICDEGIIGSSNLYVYSLASDQWSRALTHREIVDMGAVPGSEGILLSDQLLRPDRIQTSIWRDQVELTIDEGHRIYRLTGRSDPSGTYVGLHGYDSQAFSGGQYALDISNCEDGNCSPIAVPGALRWSPDGQRTLFVDASSNQLINLGDNLGRSSVQVGTGRDPFWLGDDLYGFIQTVDNPEIVTASIDLTDPQVILTSADISEAITGTNESDVMILRVAVQPLDSNILIITAGNRVGNKVYLVAYDWLNASSRLIFESEVSASGLASVAFSPSGRWLLIGSPALSDDNVSSTIDIALYDTETGESQILLSADGRVSPSLGWSADGEWLFQLNDGILVLTALDEMYQHLVIHDLNSCRGASWTNSS